MATTNLNIRIDSELKKKAEQIFEELGISMSAALNVFLRQTVRNNGIPFDLRIDGSNTEAVSAIDVADVGRKASKSFSSIRELKENFTRDTIDQMLCDSVTESLIGVLPPLRMTLEEYRAERLAKYEPVD